MNTPAAPIAEPLIEVIPARPHVVPVAALEGLEELGVDALEPVVIVAEGRAGPRFSMEVFHGSRFLSSTKA